ncbi:MAG: DUF2304 domain-containing protein [Clostridia bacterium]
MQLSLRIALLMITAIYLFVVLKSIKHKKMQISFSIFWLLTGVLLLIALLIPNSIETISGLLGFELTVNMIFCVTIFIAFYLIFNLTTIISKQSQKNVTLVQEISILKKRIEVLENLSVKKTESIDKEEKEG